MQRIKRLGKLIKDEIEDPYILNTACFVDDTLIDTRNSRKPDEFELEALLKLIKSPNKGKIPERPSDPELQVIHGGEDSARYVPENNKKRKKKVAKKQYVKRKEKITKQK